MALPSRTTATTPTPVVEIAASPALCGALETPGPEKSVASGESLASGAFRLSNEYLDDALGLDVLEPLRARQREALHEGQHVFDLSMVNPDLNPPRVVLDRLLEAVTKPMNHRYAVSRGVRRLREAFAEKYSVRFGVSLDPERGVCVCLGSKDATFHALRVLVGSGDTVVVGAPTYPAHLSAVALTGASAHPWAFTTDPAEAAQSLDTTLEKTGAKVVVLNFPNNPTGAVVTREWWTAVIEVITKRGAYLINDFVYGEMGFAPTPILASCLSTEWGTRRCLEVYSLSKAYNVPGWRVGALLGDPDVVHAVARLKSHADYGLFLPLQYGAAAALSANEDLVRPTVTAYERRLRVLVQGLKKLGWDPLEPRAGASVWVRYPAALGGSAEAADAPRSVAVAHKLFEQSRVLVTPGVVFGPQFDEFVRFAAVVPEERMRDVVMALERGVAR